MAEDPRAVRLARRRMLLTAKPKERITLPVRGSATRKVRRIRKLDGTPAPRLKVRK